MRFSYSTTVSNIVYISHSISELQEHASSHCSLLWYTKGIVYQQNYHKIGVESLNSTCFQSFVPFSEIRKFNWKKKKKKMTKSGYFRFDTFPTVQTDPFSQQT